MLDPEPEEPSAEAVHVSHTDESTSHNKRQSTKCCACDVAKYEMTFIGNWSRETHPKDFPPKQFGMITLVIEAFSRPVDISG